MSPIAASSKVEYYKGTYRSDHWALQPYHLTDPKVVALIHYKGLLYGAYMNPTDSRGYRCIVRFINNDAMTSTINRPYSVDERIGLGLAIQLVADAFTRLVPIVQTAIAGNNSHKFHAESNTTFIGHAEEPSFLHGHIFGRGGPEVPYISDVKLNDPVPGLNFDMMAKTLNEPRNDHKILWGPGEMEKVVQQLKVEIEAGKEPFMEHGLTVFTA